MFCCENYENENEICENCGRPIIKEGYLGMLPTFGVKAVPVISKSVPRMDNKGIVRMVQAEYAIPFPAAFHVAMHNKDLKSLELKTCSANSLYDYVQKVTNNNWPHKKN